MVSQEIHSGWLKHWICMLLGNYVDENLWASIYNIIDTVIELVLYILMSHSFVCMHLNSPLCTHTFMYCFRQNSITISTRDKMILYQITNAAVQLTETEIQNLLCEVNCLTEERSQFELAIKNYRHSSSQLMLKKRHPVLLILDEVYYYKMLQNKIIMLLIYSQLILKHLECLPWETIPYLKRHPVSRISSIHIAHRLYTKHKNSIQNGLM